MIDTVILAIPKDKFTRLAPSINRTFPEWIPQRASSGYQIWIKNGPKQRKDTDPYYPRLTAHTRQTAEKSIVTTVNIEFSVPKLIYNNNLNELEEKDFGLVINNLHEVLLKMGEVVSKNDLRSASVSGFDSAKNITLSDGYTAHSVIRELGKININKKLELTKVTFKNDGQGLQIYSKQYSVVFYDKIADLNQKVKRAIDKDQTPLQQSLFKDIKQHQPFLEILRIEVRLRKKQKMNSVLKILGLPTDPKFQDVFKKDVCQKIVRWYWDTIIKNENLFLFELENNPKRILRKILRAQEKIGAKQAVYLVGLNLLCRDEGGIRELRQILEKRTKQRNWYRFSDKIKELNTIVDNTELHSWVGVVDIAIKNFEPYRANSP